MKGNKKIKDLIDGCSELSVICKIYFNGTPVEEWEYARLKPGEKTHLIFDGIVVYSCSKYKGYVEKCEKEEK